MCGSVCVVFFFLWYRHLANQPGTAVKVSLLEDNLSDFFISEFSRINATLFSKDLICWCLLNTTIPYTYCKLLEDCV